MKPLFLIHNLSLYIFLFLSFQISPVLGQNDKDTLLLVKEGEFWGYINTNGNWAIKPIYWAAQNFSEGLAPVRPNGLYGYISTKGTLIIPAKYDYAEPFTDGYGKVYIGSKPFYINKSNKILFDHNYKNIEYIPNTQTFKVMTKKSNKGIIDKYNNIIIDTIYRFITPIEDFAFLVEKNNQKGILDKTGNVLIPVGKYNLDFLRGDWVYAFQYQHDILVENKLINLKDQSKSIKIPFDRRLREINGNLISLYSTEHNYSSNNLMELMNLNGEIIYKDYNYQISEFNHGRAFLRKDCGREPEEVYLIDEKINILAGPFSDYSYSPFINGYNLVKLNNTWNLIDTNGKTSSLNLSGKLTNLRYEGLFVIADSVCYNLNTRTIHKSQYPTGGDYYFNKGFCIYTHWGQTGVINPSGHIIWSKTVTKDHVLNIDYRAYSFLNQLEDTNIWKKYLDTCTRNDLHLRFIEKNNTQYLILANNSNESVHWKGDIILKVQVLNPNNEWKGITGGYDGCGYGMFDQVNFRKKEYKMYSLIKFSGAVKSLLRVEFVYQDIYGFRHSAFSNTIPCSYNPGQMSINYNKYSF